MHLKRYCHVNHYSRNKRCSTGYWYICEKTEDEYLNRTAGIKAREDLDVIFKQCGMKMINLVVGEDSRTRAGVISKIMGHIATKKYLGRKISLCT